MCVLLFDVFNGYSLVKKYIGKGMSNIYYWEKLTFSKLVGKVNYSERKFWRNALALKSKRVQGIFGENFILALLSSAVFRLQNSVSDFFLFVLLGR